MDKIFLSAVEQLLKHEGGYVNNPLDKGGETNFGLSKRTYPDLDIKILSRQQAIEIYYNDWWLEYGYHSLPPQIAQKIFNTAVNTGPRRAHLFAQTVLNDMGQSVAKDGIIGPITRKALYLIVKTHQEQEFLERYRQQCALYYKTIVKNTPSQRIFLSGWLKRAYS